MRTYFFENPVGIFCLFISLLEIPDKSKVHPWKLCKTVLHPSEIPRPKITTPGNSTCYFFNIYIPPGNSISSTPPPVLFFSGITQCKEGVFFFHLILVGISSILIQSVKSNRGCGRWGEGLLNRQNSQA